MTVDQIAQKFGVDKTTAYGLVRFLEKKGLLVTAGTTRKEGARGKGSTLYTVAVGAQASLEELFRPLFGTLAKSANPNAGNTVMTPVGPSLALEAELVGVSE